MADLAIIQRLRQQARIYLERLGRDPGPDSIDTVVNRLLENPEREPDVSDLPEARTGVLSRAGDIFHEMLSLPATAGTSPQEQQVAAGRHAERFTPAHAAGQQAVAEAETPRETIAELLSHPMQLAGLAAQQAPMLAGTAGVGRVLRAVPGVTPSVAARTGEALTAGVLAAEDAPPDAGPAERAAAGIATGLLTAGAGTLGARAARQAGAVDPEQVLVGDLRQLAADRLAVLSGVPIQAGEEWLQGASEAVVRNIAEGKHFTEDTLKSAALEAAAGATVGAGVEAASFPARQRMEREAAQQQQEAAEQRRRDEKKAKREDALRRQEVQAAKQRAEAAAAVERMRAKKPEPKPEPEPQPTPEPEAAKKTPAVEAEHRVEPEAAATGTERVPPPAPAEPAPKPVRRRALKIDPVVKERVQESLRGRQVVHAATAKEAEQTADLPDARYREARGTRAINALEAPTPRLIRAINAIEKSETAAGRDPSQAQSLAAVRDVVASDAADNLLENDNEAAAEWVNKRTDRQLQEIWRKTDEGKDTRELRRQNPRYQQDSLEVRAREATKTVEPQVFEDAPKKAVIAERTAPVRVQDTGEPYDHAADTQPDHPKRIRPAAEAPATKRSAAFFQRTGERLPARWAVIEADQAIPSHVRGVPSPENVYPAGMQGRDYTRKDMLDLVERKIGEADVIELTETPSGVTGGAPTLLPSGAALSGNQRVMIARGVYDRGGARAQEYREAVLERASELGMQVPEGMARPMLVRLLEPSERFADVEQTFLLNQASDAPTAKEKPSEELAFGRQGKMQATANLLVEAEPDQTVGQFMEAVGTAKLAGALVDDQVFADEELTRLMAIDRKTEAAALTEEGEGLFRSLMRQRVLQSPQAAAAMPSWMSNKLADTWHLAAAAENESSVQLGEVLRDAVEYVNEAQASLKKGGRLTPEHLREFYRQGRAQGRYPEWLGEFTGWLADPKTKPATIRDVFHRLARVDTEPGMFGVPTTSTVVNELFGFESPWAWGEAPKIAAALEQSGESVIDREGWRAAAEDLFRGQTGQGRPAARAATSPGALASAGRFETDPDTAGAERAAGVDPGAIPAFDERSAVQLVEAVGGRVRVAQPRIEQQMERGGVSARAVPRGLRIVLNPQRFNELPSAERVALIAHEFGHIAALAEHEPGVGEQGGIVSLLGKVGRSMRRNPDMGTAQVYAQMLNVSNAWRPRPPDADDAYNKYRDDPREVFADFYSAVLTNPEWARKHAPRAWDAFHANMPKETRQAYERLLDALRTPEARLASDVAFEEGLETSRQEAEEVRDRIDRVNRQRKWKNSLRWLDTVAAGRGAPLFRIAQQAEKRGLIDPERNPHRIIGQRPDRNTEIARRMWRVPEILNRHDLSERHLENLLFYQQVKTGDVVFDEAAYEARQKEIEARRAAGEQVSQEDVDEQTTPVKFIHRLEMGGFSPERATRRLEDLRNELGNDRFDALQQAGQVIWDAQADVAGRLAESGIISRKAYDIISQGEHYTPRAILDFGGTASISGIPQERRGTVRKQDRKITAAEERIAQALIEANRNEGRVALIDMVHAMAADRPGTFAGTTEDEQSFRRRVGRGQRGGKFNWMESVMSAIPVTAERVPGSVAGGRDVPGGWRVQGLRVPDSLPDADKDRIRKEFEEDREFMDDLRNHRQVIAVRRDGQTEHYAVDRYLAAALEGTSSNIVAQVMRMPNLLSRTAFLTLSPNWHGSNALRDATSAWIRDPNVSAIPGIGAGQIIWDYLRAIPIAQQAAKPPIVRRRRAAAGVRRAQRYAELEDAGVFPGQHRADVIYGEYGQRIDEHFSVRDHIKAGAKEQDANVGMFFTMTALARKAAEIVFINPMIKAESLPRVAAAERMRRLGHVDAEGRLQLGLKETRRIREDIGSPPVGDPIWRGTNPAVGALFQFGNSAVTGLRRMWFSLARDTTPRDAWLLRSNRAASLAKASQLIGLVGLAAAVKMGDDDDDNPWVKTIREMPWWQLGGAVPVLPAPDGEWLLLPIEHSFLPITGTIATALEKAQAGEATDADLTGAEVAVQVGTSLASETWRTALPSMSATLDWGADSLNVLMGENPMDEWRKQTHFTEFDFDRYGYGERVARWFAYDTMKTFNAQPIGEALVSSPLVGRPDFVPERDMKDAIPVLDKLAKRFLTGGYPGAGAARAAYTAGETGRRRRRQEEGPREAGTWGVSFARENPNAAPEELRDAAREWAVEAISDRRKRTAAARSAAREAFFRLPHHEKWMGLKPLTTHASGGEEEYADRLRGIINSGAMDEEEVRTGVQALWNAGVLGRRYSGRARLLMNTLDEIREGR